jgi:hypothetical protein
MSTDVSELRAASIITALMMEAARTCKTSVDINLTTLQYIPRRLLTSRTFRFHKVGEFLDQLANHRVLKEVSKPWR